MTIGIFEVASPPRACRFGAERDDHIYLVLDQLTDQLIETIADATSVSVLEVDVLVLDPAKLAQPFPQLHARALGPIALADPPSISRLAGRGRRVAQESC
jgi:hypothetical protein